MSLVTVLFLVFFVAMFVMHMRGQASHGTPGGHSGCGGHSDRSDERAAEAPSHSGHAHG